MSIRSALRMYRGMAQAVPPGAARPSSTFWYDPGGVNPPVTWSPGSGVFETHWDWAMGWALAIPGYWRARMLISQSIGAMPIGAWEDNTQLSLPGVLRQPNPPEARTATVAAWVCDLLDHGNAFGLIDHHPTREDDSIAPIPSTRVTVARTRVGDTAPIRYYLDGDYANPIDPSRVFHVKGVSGPGDLRGQGILEAGLSTLTRLSAEDAYASKAFNSGVPSGLLRVRDPDLQVGNDDDPAGYATAKGIKKAWQSSVSTGDVAVLSELVDFTPLSWTPSDAQMVEARQLSFVDVANLFNLDPYWVGSSQTSAPYQNVQDSAVQLVRFTLNYWITEFEEAFSRLLPGAEARFNRDTILREPATVRIDNAVKLINVGAMTVDEFRADEGKPPMDAPQSVPAGVTPLFPGGDSSTNQPAVGE